MEVLVLNGLALEHRVKQGEAEPVGIYSTCAWSTADFSPTPTTTEEPVEDTIGTCIDCMLPAHNYTMCRIGGDQDDAPFDQTK